MFLFFSFNSLRDPYFALFLSLLSLCFHLQRRQAMLFLATVAALFTWPAAFLANAALLAFPWRPDPACVPPVSPTWAGSSDHILRLAGIGAYAVLSVHFVYQSPQPIPYGAA